MNRFSFSEDAPRFDAHVRLSQCRRSCGAPPASAWPRLARKVNALGKLLTSHGPRFGRAALSLVAAVGSLSGIAQADTTNLNSRSLSATSITWTEFHNWSNSILISNGKVEAVIAPAIGRVMQFKFVGDDDGPLWNNRTLDGKAPDPKATEWLNFGGDKSWPAPQADWSNIIDRPWPPPPAFDSMPAKATVEQGMVTLISPVDPFYGIRTIRQMMLVPGEPVMRIETTYEKVQGDPKRVGVWVITQVRNPVGVYLRAPSPSIFTNGCNNQGPALPPSLRIEQGLLSLSRDSNVAYKIGSDASALLWVGEKTLLLIESPRTGKDDYPDQGSSVEVYTNPDALPYVELEILGPLHALKVGDRIQRSSTYTLFHRGKPSSEAQARAILGQ
jgi:hypothetical protein